jgi:hypothetical protein
MMPLLPDLPQFLSSTMELSPSPQLFSSNITLKYFSPFIVDLERFLTTMVLLKLNRMLDTRMEVEVIHNIQVEKLL